MLHLAISNLLICVLHLCLVSLQHLIQSNNIISSKDQFEESVGLFSTLFLKESDSVDLWAKSSSSL